MELGILKRGVEEREEGYPYRNSSTRSRSTWEVSAQVDLSLGGVPNTEFDGSRNSSVIRHPGSRPQSAGGEGADGIQNRQSDVDDI